MGSFNDYLNKLKNTAGYYAAAAKDNFVNELLRMMSEKKVNQKDLAQKVGVSTAYVSRVLSGDMNLSIESMSKFAFALGSRIEISAKPIAEEKGTVLLESACGMPGNNRVTADYSLKREDKAFEEIIAVSGGYADGDSVSTLAA